jgi:hypothetical protein
MAIKTVQFTLNGQTVSLSLDSASNSYKGSISAPGATSWGQNDDHKYHGEVKVTDTAGNVTTATVTDFSTLALRVLETIKPSISATYPTAGAYITNSKPTIKWTVTDADSGIDASTISIKIDSGAAVTDGITKTATTTGYTCEYTPSTALSEGSHTFTFAVSDNDGNAADAASVTCTIDTVPPTMSVPSPVDGLVTNNRNVPFSLTTNDATSSPVTVTYQVNNGSAVSVSIDTSGNGSGNVTLPDTDGIYEVKFTAKDSAGKTTTITRTVELDTTAPTIKSITLTPNPVDAGATYVVTVVVED